MRVSSEKIPQSQVVLTIEVEPERLQGALDSASRRLASKARVPGFRPGKAPAAMVERYLGRDRILEEALDRLVPAVYREAVEQEGVDVIDLPHLAVESTEPLVVKATVPVRPSVDLGDYRALRLPMPAVEVDEAPVEEELQRLRRRYATLLPVQRPAQWNDIIRADVFGRVGERVLLDEEGIEFQLREGEVISFPGFAENLLGMTRGETKEFDVRVSDDVRDEHLRGGTCHYRVILKETKEEQLPELNEDFAREVGEGFASVDALRDRIRGDLRQAEEENAERNYQDEIISRLVEQAEMEYPDVLVDREIERMLRDQAGQDRRDMERYLQRIGKSEEEVRQELLPAAEARLRRSLVLTQVADAEHIDVTEDEVQAEIDRVAASAGPRGGEIRKLFETESGRDSVRRSLLTRKTLQRLTAIAAGEAGAGETGEAEAAAATEEPQDAAATTTEPAPEDTGGTSEAPAK